MTISRPTPGDYADYFQKYLDAAGGPNALDVLGRQDATIAALAACPAGTAAFRYADGKWSVREVIGHMADTERIFAYRLLRVARGDATPLAGFDENAYQSHSGFDSRTLASLIAELAAVRNASMTLVRSLDDAALDRSGTASDQRVTARSLVWLIAGHFAHHAAILKDRYGV